MLFTAKERKFLTKLLSKVIDPEEAFNMEELHGFLFGLAIVPAMIKPSEWLTIAFGEEMMEFEDEAEAEELMGKLFKIYNRIIKESHAGKLSFPFDMARLKDGDLDRIRDWTYGFYVALSLRNEIWGFKEMDDDEMTEEEQNLTSSFAVIAAVARPEYLPEIFEQPTYDPGTQEKDFNLEATLFALLPAAVTTVKEYARNMLKSRGLDVPVSSHRTKIGRNDTCPCGSGKKYKKCCGFN